MLANGTYSRLGSASMPGIRPGLGDGLPGKVRRRDRRKLRVAHFTSLSGSAGIWGPPSVNSAVLAASEINKRGGILGREIELVVHDAGKAPEDLTRAAEDLVASEDADIVVGSHMSAARVSLRQIFKGRLPYVYTPIYEGGERTPGVLAIGETPPRQARPAIAWLAERRRARSWYLIGSDYVWPWLSHRAVKRYIAEAGGRVVGEDFVPVGEHDHGPYLERIRAIQPDVVFISLIGLDGIVFNRSFGEQGLGSRILRLANCVDETVLLGIGADNTANLFAASGYFASVCTGPGETFRDAYRKAFGALAPLAGSTAQSNYEGLYFLEAVARRAGTLDLCALSAAAEGAVYSGGRGPLGMLRRNVEMPIYFAEAEGFDFRLRETF
ncbi:MAG: substrate-binding domain-containing protein [Proteobacteria bacterium]|nr:substrate-binding domain-containing protein [Pseudomonadota bacterium]